MTNHSYVEEALSKQNEAIVRVEKDIQNHIQNSLDMEHMHSEKATIMSKLIPELVENIESMQRSVPEMENKYKESLNIIKKLTSEGDTKHEECHKEVQQLKVMNSIISHEMECMKKEHEQISMELKENKAISDLQQKNFTEVIQKNVMEISSLQFAALKQQDEYENVLKLAEVLKEKNEQLNAPPASVPAPSGTSMQSSDVLVLMLQSLYHGLCLLMQNIHDLAQHRPIMSMEAFMAQVAWPGVQFFPLGGGEAPTAQEPQPEAYPESEVTPEATPQISPAATPLVEVFEDEDDFYLDFYD
ncbi:uncharacterized protein [Glycine max]|uniref:uncharacterized protein n=2 Tax=Glycine subgen. Soja TaxID=1462606 RepID=UPI0008630644|nr:uncharacterized protein LOC121174024 [Glycine max]